MVKVSCVGRMFLAATGKGAARNERIHVSDRCEASSTTGRIQQKLLKLGSIELMGIKTTRNLQKSQL